MPGRKKATLLPMIPVAPNSRKGLSEILKVNNHILLEEKPLSLERQSSMHKIQTDSISNDGSGRHQSPLYDHLAFEDYESDDSSYIGKSSELASVTDSDEEDQHPGLEDSDDEENVPHLPEIFLSKH